MKTTRFLLVLLFFLGFSQSSRAFAQSDSLRDQYINEFSKLIFVGPLIKHRSVSFQLTNRLDRSKKITFRPNNSYSTGFRLNLFGIGLEASVAIPIARKNSDRYGNSDVSDLYFNSFSRKWMADFTRQRYSGFYFERSWQPLPAWESRDQRKDVEIRNSALNFTYIFNNKKFSIRSPFQFNEHQIKSSGSFLFGFVFSKFQVSGDSSITWENDKPMFSDGSDFRYLDIVTLGLMPGYSYNLIHRNFFLNMTGLVGPSHHWVKYGTAENFRHYDIDFNLAASFRAALGYNGANFFAGISYSATANHSRLLETQFSSSIRTFRLVAGIRFKERGIFTKRVTDLYKALL